MRFWSGLIHCSQVLESFYVQGPFTCFGKFSGWLFPFEFRMASYNPWNYRIPFLVLPGKRNFAFPIIQSKALVLNLTLTGLTCQFFPGVITTGDRINGLIHPGSMPKKLHGRNVIGETTNVYDNQHPFYLVEYHHV